MSPVSNPKFILPLIAIPELQLPNSATDDEIGAAAVYDLQLLVDHIPIPPEPPWLQNLNDTIQQIRTDLAALVASVNALTATTTINTANIVDITADVAVLRRRLDEQPVLMANSRAGHKERLYNPLALLPNGWAVLLVRPNPLNRDELMCFSGEKLTILSSEYPTYTTAHQQLLSARPQRLI